MTPCLGTQRDVMVIFRLMWSKVGVYSSHFSQNFTAARIFSLLVIFSAAKGQGPTFLCLDPRVKSVKGLVSIAPHTPTLMTLSADFRNFLWIISYVNFYNLLEKIYINCRIYKLRQFMRGSLKRFKKISI